MELEAALSEAEGALEQEENKVLRAQLELTQGMQATLETETKGKCEALRMKKKLESDVCDLETALEHANAANAESQKTIKKYTQSLREVQARLEEESHAKEVAHDNLLLADRRAHANQNALEEARTLLEQADRARRIVEQELCDTNETLSDQTCSNQANEGQLSESKAQSAMIDAARLADELRAEQETAMMLERDRKLMEAQVKDMQAKVDEAEQNALKGGKKAMAKMESRIRELESEMDAESRRMNDAQKNLRRSERRIKEPT